MRKLNLSLNPSYLCNFRCSFCYLRSDQLSDKTKLSLDLFEQRLSELREKQIVLNRVDLYGGEIALLRTEYLEQIFSLLEKYGITEINAITNLSAMHPVLFNDKVYVTVSYDFEARENHDQVFQNMCKLEKPFSVLVLASPQVIQMNADLMINMFNSLSFLQSVEIKPYSTNQANQHLVSYADYENFVKKWITSSVKKNFQFVNEDLILDCVDGIKNAYSDDHIYLNPFGKWTVLDFDCHDHEFFRELESIEEYDEWAQQEKIKVKSNKFCSSCRYVGGCLTEHYREVKSLDQSCNGFKNLLDWAADFYK